MTLCVQLVAMQNYCFEQVKRSVMRDVHGGVLMVQTIHSMMLSGTMVK